MDDTTVHKWLDYATAECGKQIEKTDNLTRIEGEITCIKCRPELANYPASDQWMESKTESVITRPAILNLSYAPTKNRYSYLEAR